MMKDLNELGYVQDETRMMMQAAKTGKEPVVPSGMLAGLNRHEIKKFLKENPMSKLDFGKR